MLFILLFNSVVKGFFNVLTIISVMNVKRNSVNIALIILSCLYISANNHATFPIQMYMNYSTYLRLFLSHPVEVTVHFSSSIV